MDKEILTFALVYAIINLVSNPTAKAGGLIASPY